MWGDEPQLQSFRERLKVLLEAHQQELNPQRINASDGEVLFRQGEPVDTLLLLTSGRVAVDVHQGDAVHTLAVIEAVELLGEVGFSPAQLRNPNTYVSYSKLAELLEISAAACGEPMFGLMLSRDQTSTVLGDIAMTLFQQPT